MGPVFCIWHTAPMAEKDADEAALELPKLGFGRRRRGARKEAPAAEERTEVLEPQAADPAADQAAEAPTETPAPPPPPPAEPVRPLYADEATPTAEAAEAPVEETRVQPVLTEEPTRDSDSGSDAPAGGERRARPRIGGLPASVLTGLVVGLAGVGLTGAGFRLCEVVQGTSSCGKPGFLLLLAILIVMVYLGRGLLAVFGVPDAGSTSFLAVGLLAVVTLMFLVDVLFDPWMVLVVPLVAMTAYGLSHWVTTSVADAAVDR